MDTLPSLTKRQASLLIDQIHADPITPKQAELLINLGYQRERVSTMSKLNATIAIGRATRMTTAQAQALNNAGIHTQELQKKGIYLSKKEASEMLDQIYANSPR